MPVIVTCQSKVSKIKQITGNFETGRSMYNFDVGDKPSMSSNTFGLIISAKGFCFNRLSSVFNFLLDGEAIDAGGSEVELLKKDLFELLVAVDSEFDVFF